MSFFGDKRQGWITLFPSGHLSHFDAAWSNEKLTFMFMSLLNQRVLLMKRKTLEPRQFIFLQVISTARGLINDWINLILMIVLGMPRSDRVGILKIKLCSKVRFSEEHRYMKKSIDPKNFKNCPTNYTVNSQARAVIAFLGQLFLSSICFKKRTLLSYFL